MARGQGTNRSMEREIREIKQLKVSDVEVDPNTPAHFATYSLESGEGVSPVVSKDSKVQVVVFVDGKNELWIDDKKYAYVELNLDQTPRR